MASVLLTRPTVSPPTARRRQRVLAAIDPFGAPEPIIALAASAAGAGEIIVAWAAPQANYSVGGPAPYLMVGELGLSWWCPPEPTEEAEPAAVDRAVALCAGLEASHRRESLVYRDTLSQRGRRKAIARAIATAANREQVDLIVVGSSGRDPRRPMAHLVGQHTTCPIMVGTS